jgi:hypothetical protein
MKKLLIVSIAMASFSMINQQIMAAAMASEDGFYPTTYSVGDDGSVNLLGQESAAVLSESDSEVMPSIMVPSEELAQETVQEFVQEPLAMMEEDGDDELDFALEQQAILAEQADQANREVVLLNSPELNVSVQETNSTVNSLSSLEEMVRGMVKSMLAETLQDVVNMLLASNVSQAVEPQAPVVEESTIKMPELENIDLTAILPTVQSVEVQDDSFLNDSLPA